VILIFVFVHIVDDIDRFPYIRASLHPRDKAYLYIMDDRFDEFLDSGCKDFIEYFGINIPKRNWSEVLFLCWIILCSRYQSNCGFIE
jgi:hypothetical protein